MNTQEVANRLIELCRQGQNFQAIQELYHEDVESVEPDDSQSPYTKGIKEVLAKEEGFFSSVEEVHSSEVSDPQVAGNYFCCTMEMDMTFKGMGRMQLNEVCVYKVMDGKIVREEFFFDMH